MILVDCVRKAQVGPIGRVGDRKRSRQHQPITIVHSRLDSTALVFSIVAHHRGAEIQRRRHQRELVRRRHGRHESRPQCLQRQRGGALCAVRVHLDKQPVERTRKVQNEQHELVGQRAANELDSVCMQIAKQGEQLR